MRKLGLLFLVGLLALALAVPPTAGAETTSTYSVLYANGVSSAQGRLAIKAIGGTVVGENARVGLARVTTSNPHFLSDVSRQSALFGAVSATMPVGKVEDRMKRDVERETGGAVGTDAATAPAVNEPLADKQWGMDMIDASDGSWAIQPGDSRVLVGIIDTGVDATHPDIAPNFSTLSRNFTTDIPLVDGPCEEELDRSCNDPNNVDENGHGTHVAGIVGAALNGLGVAGVAPKVKLVNLRAGQDSGYFFLQPSVDALTWAADHGIDVVNMSYYIDPWLYNCPDNPADSRREQLEQRTIIEATTRALNYAHDNGVTLFGAAGNSAHDFDNKDEIVDTTSPDYPPGTEHPRQIDESCLDMPTEGPNVISVASVGPSGRKSYFSNYGLSEIEVAAPGGDRHEFFGTKRYNSPATRILSSYPRRAAHEQGLINNKQESLHPLVVVDCRETGDGRVCGVYAYLQGTSMASPHAAGVAALVVSEFGVPDPVRGGLKMNPDLVEKIVEDTAVPHACPPGGTLDYPGLSDTWTATCTGTTEFNSFYGHGIVNALNAVTYTP